MWPTTFGLKTYTILYVASMVALTAAACRLCRREKLSIWLGAILGLCYVFGMVPGAKLLHDILHQHVYWADYLKISYYMSGGLWGGPLAYLAAAVFLVACYRGDRRALMDIAVISLLPAMIVAKVACFLNGCCWGVESGLPWALVYPEGAVAPGGVARHPTQLYEMLVLVVIAVVLAAIDRRRWKGLLVLWFVAIYGVGRPLTEVFRGDGPRVPDFGPLTASQATCLAAAAIALAVLGGAAWRGKNAELKMQNAE